MHITMLIVLYIAQSVQHIFFCAKVQMFVADLLMSLIQLSSKHLLNGQSVFTRAGHKKL